MTFLTCTCSFLLPFAALTITILTNSRSGVAANKTSWSFTLLLGLKSFATNRLRYTSKPLPTSTHLTAIGPLPSLFQHSCTSAIQLPKLLCASCSNLFRSERLPYSIIPELSTTNILFGSGLEGFRWKEYTLAAFEVILWFVICIHRCRTSFNKPTTSHRRQRPENS